MMELEQIGSVIPGLVTVVSVKTEKE